MEIVIRNKNVTNWEELLLAIVRKVMESAAFVRMELQSFLFAFISTMISIQGSINMTFIFTFQLCLHVVKQ